MPAMVPFLSSRALELVQRGVAVGTSGVAGHLDRADRSRVGRGRGEERRDETDRCDERSAAKRMLHPNLSPLPSRVALPLPAPVGRRPCVRHPSRIRSSPQADLPAVSVPQTRLPGKFPGYDTCPPSGSRIPAYNRRHRGAGHPQPRCQRAFARARARVEAAGPRRDRGRASDEPDRLRRARRLLRLARRLVAARGARHRRRLPRCGRRHRAQADPGPGDLRRGERVAPRRHHEPAAGVVLEQEVPPRLEPLPRRRGGGRHLDAGARPPRRAGDGRRRLRRHARRARRATCRCSRATRRSWCCSSS